MKREPHKNAKRIILSLVSFILLVVVSLTFISAVPYLEGNKTLSSNVLSVGDRATITLTVNGAGSSGSVIVPSDFIIVIDNSCSMCGDKLSQAKLAGKAVVDSLNSVYDRVGLIYFNANPFVRNNLTQDYISVKDNISAISASGGTNIGEAIKKASEQFNNTNNSRVIVLISDGKANIPANARAYALQQARLAAANNISIYTIGIGEEFNNPGFNLLRNISRIGNGMYWHYPTVSDPNTMNDIAGWLVDDINNTVLTSVSGSNIVVTDILEQGVFPITLPADCHYIWNERRVICDAGSLNIGEVKTFSFDVFVYNSSLSHLNQIAYVNYTDYLGVNSSFLLPNPNVTVGNLGNITTNTTINITTNVTINTTINTTTNITGNATVNFTINTTTNTTTNNSTSSTNTHVHTSSCGHNTHAPVNDFDSNETADSISMNDNFVVALNYVNNSESEGFSMESYLSGEENGLIFNMILLIAIILMLLIIVLVGRRK
jgi:hypothetical protein